MWGGSTNQHCAPPTVNGDGDRDLALTNAVLAGLAMRSWAPTTPDPHVVIVGLATHRFQWRNGARRPQPNLPPSRELPVRPGPQRLMPPAGEATVTTTLANTSDLSHARRVVRSCVARRPRAGHHLSSSDRTERGLGHCADPRCGAIPDAVMGHAAPAHLCGRRLGSWSARHPGRLPPRPLAGRWGCGSRGRPAKTSKSTTFTTAAPWSSRPLDRRPRQFGSPPVTTKRAVPRPQSSGPRPRPFANTADGGRAGYGGF